MEKPKDESVKSLNVIKEHTIINANSDKISLESLWKENCTVIYLVRRFGCWLCRDAAQELFIKLSNDYKSNLNIVAIGSETLGFKEFVTGNYFKNGNVFVDETQTIQQTLARRLGFWEQLTGAFSWSTISKTMDSKKRVEGNLVLGDKPYYADTVVVIEKGTGNILHQQTFQSLSDSFNFVDIANICAACTKS